MKFSLQNTRTYQDFDDLKIGEIFLDDDDCPYIKMSEVQDRFNHDVYNCVRLSNGEQWFFCLKEKVCIPTNYTFMIDV